MRVLYELTHTACDREIMRANMQFDVLGGEWDYSGRPKPDNATMISEPRGNYDVAIVGTTSAFRKVPAGAKVIWKCLTDFGSWPKPVGILDDVFAWVAPCQETADRWGMRDHPKTRVIEHGIDPDIFSPAVGDGIGVLSVGNLLPKRPEKGPDVLIEVGRKVGVYIVGFGNEEFSKNEGTALCVLGCAKSVGDLADSYRKFRCYFNPSTVVVCSVLEAMASGLPVVTMEPGNFVDLMRHRENCLIAKTSNEAVAHLKLLMNNPMLSRDIGAAARKSVMHRFHPAIAAYKWERLICEAAEKK